MDWNIVKEKIAEKALSFVPKGTTIGLGSGTTSSYFVKALANLYKKAPFPLSCVATSNEIESLAIALGLPVLSSSSWDQEVTITFDGADAINSEGSAIKGAGGALLREKIVAFHSQKVLYMVDERKWNRPWNEVLLPTEVVPFGCRNTLQSITNLGLSAALRYQNEKVFLTSDNNYIIDITVPQNRPIGALQKELLAIPGVIETGYFHHFATAIMIGYGNGVIEERQVEHDSRFHTDLI
jgi:ribose 5-phosphate isomerase A